MPCGSPSSRLPRSPMWPLDSANTDSRLGEQVEVEARSRGRATARPGRRLLGSRDHREQLVEVLDDDVGAVRRAAPRPGRPGRRRRRAEAAGPAGLRRRPARPRRPPPAPARRRAVGAAQEGVRRGLARAGRARGRSRRRPAPRRRCQAGDLEHLLRCWRWRRRRPGAARRRARPAGSGGSPRRPRRRRSSDASAAAARSCGCRGRGRSRRRARRPGRPRAARCRGWPGSRGRRPRAACRRRSGRSRRPGRTATNGSPVRVGALAQEAVERLLPRGVVHRGGVGQHAVQVEQAGGDAVGQPEHEGPPGRGATAGRWRRARAVRPIMPRAPPRLSW